MDFIAIISKLKFKMPNQYSKLKFQNSFLFLSFELPARPAGGDLTLGFCHSIISFLFLISLIFPDCSFLHLAISP